MRTERNVCSSWISTCLRRPVCPVCSSGAQGHGEASRARIRRSRAPREGGVTVGRHAGPSGLESSHICRAGVSRTRALVPQPCWGSRRIGLLCGSTDERFVGGSTWTWGGRQKGPWRCPWRAGVLTRSRGKKEALGREPTRHADREADTAALKRLPGNRRSRRSGPWRRGAAWSLTVRYGNKSKDTQVLRARPSLSRGGLASCGRASACCWTNVAKLRPVKALRVGRMLGRGAGTRSSRRRRKELGETQRLVEVLAERAIGTAARGLAHATASLSPLAAREQEQAPRHCAWSPAHSRSCRTASSSGTTDSGEPASLLGPRPPLIRP